MSLTKRAAKLGQLTVIALVVLIIAAFAIRDPHGFGRAVKGFAGQIGDVLAGAWHVISGAADGAG
jgi:hypothetical protein